VAADLLWSGPAFRGTQHDHRPARAVGNSRAAGFLPDLSDLRDAVLHRGRHGLMHAIGLGTFHKIGRPAVAAEQVFHFLVADAGQQVGLLIL